METALEGPKNKWAMIVRSPEGEKAQKKAGDQIWADYQYIVFPTSCLIRNNWLSSTAPVPS